LSLGETASGATNIALMSPATTEADVDRHTEVFGEAVEALFA
jgi:hypothetical protein